MHDINDHVDFQEHDESALHLAILHEDGMSLHMVDFIIQNSIK